MDAKLLSFGSIEIDGRRFDHDVVIDADGVRPRKKGPSKAHRERYGHTPLSVDEAIPWSARRLFIGTGVSGQLPVLPQVFEEAQRRGVEVVARPTSEVCELLGEAEEDIAAVLHVTC